MYTVELVDKVSENESVCNDFDFETITEAYSFLWQCRESWKDPDCDLFLFHDNDLISIFDDYSV